MDACDPDTDIGDFIKFHTGRRPKISRKKMCEISRNIKMDRLPLPPLVLSRDKKYMIDSKSPLTQKDYERLFSSSVKSDEMKRIARKTGLTEVDKTISELKNAVGRRLRSMNVREPVQLHSKRDVIVSMTPGNNNNLRTPSNNNNNLRTPSNNSGIPSNNNNLRTPSNNNNLRTPSNNNNLRTPGNSRTPNVSTRRVGSKLSQQLARKRHLERMKRFSSPSKIPKPQRNNKPVVQPQRNNKPVVQPQRNNKPVVQPQRNNKPVVQPQRNSRPVVQPQRNNKPVVQPQRNSRPVVQPQRNNKPVVQPQKNNNKTQKNNNKTQKNNNNNQELKKKTLLEKIKNAETAAKNLKIKSMADMKELNEKRNVAVKKAAETNNRNINKAAVNAQYVYAKSQIEKNANVISAEKRVVSMHQSLIEEQKKLLEQKKSENAPVDQVREANAQLKKFMEDQERREKELKDKISGLESQARNLAGKVASRGTPEMKTDVKVVVNRAQNVKKEETKNDIKRKKYREFQELLKPKKSFFGGEEESPFTEENIEAFEEEFDAINENYKYDKLFRKVREAKRRGRSKPKPPKPNTQPPKPNTQPQPQKPNNQTPKPNNQTPKPNTQPQKPNNQPSIKKRSGSWFSWQSKPKPREPNRQPPKPENQPPKPSAEVQEAMNMFGLKPGYSKNNVSKAFRNLVRKQGSTTELGGRKLILEEALKKANGSNVERRKRNEEEGLKKDAETEALRKKLEKEKEANRARKAFEKMVTNNTVLMKNDKNKILEIPSTNKAKVAFRNAKSKAQKERKALLSALETVNYASRQPVFSKNQKVNIITRYNGGEQNRSTIKNEVKEAIQKKKNDIMSLRGNTDAYEKLLKTKEYETTTPLFSAKERKDMFEQFRSMNDKKKGLANLQSEITKRQQVAFEKRVNNSGIVPESKIKLKALYNKSSNKSTTATNMSRFEKNRTKTLLRTYPGTNNMVLTKIELNKLEPMLTQKERASEVKKQAEFIYVIRTNIRKLSRVSRNIKDPKVKDEVVSKIVAIEDELNTNYIINMNEDKKRTIVSDLQEISKMIPRSSGFSLPTFKFSLPKGTSIGEQFNIVKNYNNIKSIKSNAEKLLKNMEMADTEGATQKLKNLKQILVKASGIAGGRVDPKNRPTGFTRVLSEIQKIVKQGENVLSRKKTKNRLTGILKRGVQKVSNEKTVKKLVGGVTNGLIKGELIEEIGKFGVNTTNLNKKTVRELKNQLDTLRDEEVSRQKAVSNLVKKSTNAVIAGGAAEQKRKLRLKLKNSNLNNQSKNTFGNLITNAKTPTNITKVNNIIAKAIAKKMANKAKAENEEKERRQLIINIPALERKLGGASTGPNVLASKNLKNLRVMKKRLEEKQVAGNDKKKRNEIVNLQARFGRIPGDKMFEFRKTTALMKISKLLGQNVITDENMEILNQARKDIGVLEAEVAAKKKTQPTNESVIRMVKALRGKLPNKINPNVNAFINEVKQKQTLIQNSSISNELKYKPVEIMYSNKTSVDDLKKQLNGMTYTIGGKTKKIIITPIETIINDISKMIENMKNSRIKNIVNKAQLIKNAGLANNFRLTEGNTNAQNVDVSAFTYSVNKGSTVKQLKNVSKQNIENNIKTAKKKAAAAAEAAKKAENQREAEAAAKAEKQRMEAEKKRMEAEKKRKEAEKKRKKAEEAEKQRKEAEAEKQRKKAEQRMMQAAEDARIVEESRGKEAYMKNVSRRAAAANRERAEAMEKEIKQKKSNILEKLDKKQKEIFKGKINNASNLPTLTSIERNIEFEKKRERVRERGLYIINKGLTKNLQFKFKNATAFKQNLNKAKNLDRYTYTKRGMTKKISQVGNKEFNQDITPVTSKVNSRRKKNQSKLSQKGGQKTKNLEKHEKKYR